MCLFAEVYIRKKKKKKKHMTWSIVLLVKMREKFGFSLSWIEHQNQYDVMCLMRIQFHFGVITRFLIQSSWLWFHNYLKIEIYQYLVNIHPQINKKTKPNWVNLSKISKGFNINNLLFDLIIDGVSRHLKNKLTFNSCGTITFAVKDIEFGKLTILACGLSNFACLLVTCEKWDSLIWESEYRGLIFQRY